MYPALHALISHCSTEGLKGVKIFFYIYKHFNNTQITSVNETPFFYIYKHFNIIQVTLVNKILFCLSELFFLLKLCQTLLAIFIDILKFIIITYFIKISNRTCNTVKLSLHYLYKGQTIKNNIHLQYFSCYKTDKYVHVISNVYNFL